MDHISKPVLGEVFDPARNGLNICRLFLAGLVVLGHTYELTGASDPVLSRFSVTLGEIAVNAFFGISGFLISASWVKRPLLIPFMRNRTRRILPGLWFCLLITAFFWFPLIEVLHNGRSSISIFDSLRYVFANSFIRLNVTKLGGVFVGLPSDGIVNNSLWSLFPEILCYILVPVVFVFGRRVKVGWVWLPAAVLFLLAIIVDLAGPDSFSLNQVFPGGRAWLIWRYSTQACFFLSGVLLFLLKNSIHCSWPAFSVCFAVFAFAAASGFYHQAAPFLLPYCVISFCALTPSLGYFDRFGDFSYGLYIYHYPAVQTMLWFGLPAALHPFLFAATSLLIAMPLAVFSWYFVERPFLQKRQSSMLPSVAQ
jgi:peptidoglycan/LPS O-acetylase OafA/YrhL